MRPTEALQHQSKTIAKLMLEVAHHKAKYEALRGMAYKTIKKQSEMLHKSKEENAELSRILAG